MGVVLGLGICLWLVVGEWDGGWTEESVGVGVSVSVGVDCVDGHFVILSQ